MAKWYIYPEILGGEYKGFELTDQSPVTQKTYGSSATGHDRVTFTNVTKPKKGLDVFVERQNIHKLVLVGQDGSITLNDETTLFIRHK